ncbi:MAG: pyrroline-5-carboxylate reductase [Bacteroidia bacterium]|nr:pyrroline-5-carboxylate reductase [Bacteroidia bacterium]
MFDKKVSIIGCGNIGLSLLQGLLKDKTIPANNITATRRNIQELAHLKEYGVRLTTDNISAVEESDLILVAVKPYNIVNILEEIKDYLNPTRHILISVTAGVTFSQIQDVVRTSVPIFRAMPNISASVGKSVSCICHNGANTKDIESVKYLFDIIGTTMTIDEELMESATILGACGIAYVLRFIRAMIQGGIQIGFDARTASAIVNQTVKGAAELLIERKKHPEYEIDKVTTPKGCTIVGLNEMEHNGFSSSLIKGIVASYEKIEK